MKNLLYLYNDRHTLIAQNDDSDLCTAHQSLIQYPALSEDNYSIAITGTNHSHGHYSLQISCYSAPSSHYECMMNMYICHYLCNAPKIYNYD